ncbi:threonine synthase [Reichenbachiella sp. MALMAid0571]|uniref:threonine synthase n=1 Tax=Reichenbachiella sp. MALMAid0571 TaxID=3143939 RepID=UPI0032DE3A80
MKYYSTNKSVPKVSFEEAIVKGLPEDNGLFMPEKIVSLPQSFIDGLKGSSLQEIGYEVASRFIDNEIPEANLRTIVNDTLAFDIPAVRVEDNVYSLELFHGPTLAFKDVGARFLARCLSYFSAKKARKATILVATSGDTGSAVAHGFLGLENINVVILYPKGKVSDIQEKQLTTLGQNITALEVDGTFDDCQALVKKSFLDKPIKDKFHLTSANSINMARLIPQSFYYFWAYAQVKDGNRPVYISVPSGNYGNLTAGLLAQKMGLPIDRFIASANANDIVPAYLTSGVFDPKASVQTISNAMDVGNPSNFARMMDLFGGDVNEFRNYISGYSYSDEETRACMQAVFAKQGYMLDPHGAVGYLGLKEYMKDKDGVGVFFETAHPAKFGDVVEETIHTKIDIPARLQEYVDKTKVSIEINNSYEELLAVFGEVLV